MLAMTQSFEILLAAAAFAGIVVITAVTLAVLQSRAIVRLRRECTETDELLAHVRREAHSAVTYASDVGKRLRKAEKELAALTDQLAQLELHGDPRSFERAINVARQGADANKLVSNIGMSRGEAELMSVVHGGKAATG